MTNEEKRRESRRKYYSNHHEEALASIKAWHAAHPEYMKQWEQTHKHPCIDCGKPCSRVSVRCKSCALKLAWAQGKMYKNHPRGKDHPMWKGGRQKYRGYIVIYKPDHPRANSSGYVWEHWLIWEQANNKPLPKGWIIHHLNGIKDDNRPRNLQALPNKKHYLVLQAKAKRIQELEAALNGQSQLL